jgi:putative tryptophan/tyrosine transport system substrate-binding protein
MRRRELIALLGSVAAWPLAARAQPGERMRRLGVLSPYAGRVATSSIDSFTQRLQQLGWMDGRNLRIDYRWAAGDISRLRSDAVELVRLRPEVILAGGSPGLTAAQEASRTIPIVFVNVADPVGQGFVASLARPGGNATGFTNFEFSMGGKWLEALKDMAPRTVRVALIVNPNNPSASIFLRSVETVAASFGIETVATAVRDKGEIERAISALDGASVGGLVVFPDALPIIHSQLIIALAARHRLPVVYPFRDFVVDGGLVSYGINASDQYRQAADYVNRILRGANPADLPVQAPTQFELVINLKTAKSLGLEVPPTLLARATEVIE